MDIDKRSRTELKSYFVENSIPTETNFAELIDGMLNQKDDGLVKPSGSPLSIEAAGDDASTKQAINLYKNLGDAVPEWSISLNPRGTPGDPKSARLGFGITDGQDNNRLFIDLSSGNVGIGTTNPSQKLQLSGGNAVINNVFLGDVGHGPAYAGFSHSASVGPQSYGLLQSQDGLYTLINKKSGGGYIGFRVDNADKMVVTGGGDVGIGTANPGARLEVRQSSGSTTFDAIRFGDSAGFAHIGAGATAFGFADRNKNMRLAISQQSGNVGIWTTDPMEALHVNGSVRGDQLGALRISTGHGYTDIGPKNALWAHFYTDRPRFYFDKEIQVNGGLIGSYDANLKLTTAGATRLTILRDNGNVGIGTDAPQNKLHVVGAGPVTIENAGEADILYKDTASKQEWQAGTNANGWYVFTGGKYHFVIKKEGQVGIGTTNPGATLDVKASTQTWGGWYEAIRLSQGAHSAITHPGGNMLFGMHSNRLFYFCDTKGAGKHLMLINANNGYVAIGPAAPSYPLHVTTGNANNWQARFTNGSSNVYLSHQGGYGMHINTGHTGQADSSARYGLEVRNANRTHLYVRDDGRIGMGTRSPADSVDMNGALRVLSGSNPIRFTSDWSNFPSSATNHAEICNDTGSRKTLMIVGNSSGGKGRKVSIWDRLSIATEDASKARLVVSGDGDRYAMRYAYLATAGNTGVGRWTALWGIWASGRIACSEINVHSDGRIKNVIGVSDHDHDLATLNRLQVTDFTYVDQLEHGPGRSKKLIGQQVREVCPDAVRMTRNYVPSIYQPSTQTTHDKKSGHLRITTERKHGLAVGDMVRIIDDEGPHRLEVLGLPDENTFNVERDKVSKNVFVYGKEVDDFLTVDYESIAMLNVSATQALATRLEKLEDENASLKAMLADMPMSNHRLEQRKYRRHHLSEGNDP